MLNILLIEDSDDDAFMLNRAFEREANAALHDKSGAPRPPVCTYALGEPLCSCVQ